MKRLAAAIFAVVLAVCAAALLFHGLAGGFRTAHHISVTGGTK